MRKTTIILTVLVVSMSFAVGQTASDSITMKKVFGGYHFYQGEKRLNINQLVKAMKPNAQAYQQVLSAQSTYTLGSLIGGAGGALVGWPIGTAIGGGDPNWTLAGIGACLIIVSIPLSQSFDKKVTQAIETYNSGKQPSSFWDKHELKVSLSDNGIGLTLNF